MTTWIDNAKWNEAFFFERPVEFEVEDGKLIQRKNIEEFDCSEYEKEQSEGKAFRCMQRVIEDDLYEKITDYIGSILDNSIMENQLDMMDAIADLYVAIESR